MDLIQRQCDVKGCDNLQADPYSIFKDRRADGAGSMENIYYVFDLCPACTRKKLAYLLTNLPSEQAGAFLKNINSREG